MGALSGWGVGIRQLQYCAVTEKPLCCLSSCGAAVLVSEKHPGVLPGFLRWLFWDSDYPTRGFGHNWAESRMVISLNRCDADPSALANYVVALVKKDKPEKELKAFCADQLDVFLQKGTVLSATSSVRWLSFHCREEEGWCIIVAFKILVVRELNISYRVWRNKDLVIKIKKKKS